MIWQVEVPPFTGPDTTWHPSQREVASHRCEKSFKFDKLSPGWRRLWGGGGGVRVYALSADVNDIFLYSTTAQGGRKKKRSTFSCSRTMRSRGNSAYHTHTIPLSNIILAQESIETALL
ncbi:hypothetical protein BaRGS_00005656 [Batillaria attramentaria]|uniref:Uncharacterized protein n=1 Tax=Batillaria attramentaria TaxID=370345 RepID=A0ABD0LTR3_9CAEN